MPTQLRDVDQLREGDSIFDEANGHVYHIDTIDGGHVTIVRDAVDDADRWSSGVIQQAISDGDWVPQVRAPRTGEDRED